MIRKKLPFFVILFFSALSCTNVDDGNAGKMAGAVLPKASQDTVSDWFNWNITFDKSTTAAIREQQLKTVEDHIRDSVIAVNGLKKENFTVSFRQDPAGDDSLHYRISTDLAMSTRDSITPLPVHNPQPKDLLKTQSHLVKLPHPVIDSITAPKQINPPPTYTIQAHKTIILKQAVDCVYVSNPPQQ